ncbi:MAG: tRNA (guanosine(37)-N1)-methyltransferase TrmD [Gemmatimonadetes bacterium]|nr:tRNA (guanosine(37)-N1)-methyltransferase TrmD [Gemmatimonadota bacterium]
MIINIVTLFPEFFREPLGLSIPGRAAEAGLVEYRLIDLRAFTHDRHRTVDDYPYGGGAGMVLKPAPFFEAVRSLAPEGGEWPAGRVLVMSARGRPFAHADAVRLSLEEEITLLCGHYKDIDQRVADGLEAEEVALGDFILSGGEIPALAIVDAVVRLLPGAISDHESASTDSFYEGLLSPPSYTRPAEFRGMEVPPVLLTGDHAKIANWRREQAERLTRERRPDLWAEHLREQGTGNREQKD